MKRDCNAAGEDSPGLRASPAWPKRAVATISNEGPRPKFWLGSTMVRPVVVPAMIRMMHLPKMLVLSEVNTVPKNTPPVSIRIAAGPPTAGGVGMLRVCISQSINHAPLRGIDM